MKIESLKRPFIIAHRGFRSKYPENTLVSFYAALDAGVEMIELDVRLSRDRKVVVIHDLTVDRTTDGEGPVKEFTLQALKNLDAGSWFHSQFRGERVPTLDEVFDQVGSRVLINVEIKADTYEEHQPPDAIERQVVDLVYRKKLLDSVLISSFEPKILESIKRMEKSTSLAFLSRNPGDDKNIGICKDLEVFSWHPRCCDLNKDRVRMLQEVGIRVFPYNVDSLEQFQQVIE